MRALQAQDKKTTRLELVAAKRLLKIFLIYIDNIIFSIYFSTIIN